MSIIYKMIEEKKASLKKKTQLGRASRFQTLDKKSKPDCSREVEPTSKESTGKTTEKNLKRIGCINQIRAYQTTIEEEHNKEHAVKPATLVVHTNKHIQVKHLKRIGKQNIVGAYIQSVTSDHRPSHEKPMQPTITINKLAYENSPEPNIRTLEDRQLITVHNSTQCSPPSQIITQERGEDEILFAQTSSDKQDHDFSINIKKVDSQDEIDVDQSSPAKKPDEQQLVMVKTQSDQAAESSDIIDGQLQKLINDSALTSENPSDSKMEQLLEQIQKGGTKNFEALKEDKKKDSSNYLMVPKQRSSEMKNPRTSKVMSKRSEAQVSGYSWQVKQQQSLLIDSQIESGKNGTSLRSENRSEKKSDVFIQEKKEKAKKELNKKSFECWLSDKKFILNQQKRQQKQKKANLSNSNYEEKENDGGQSSSGLKQKKRLLASEGPRKETQASHQKISKSVVKLFPSVNGPKMSQSQHHSGKINSKDVLSQYSKSVHEKSMQKQKVLHKQSIAARFKSKLPKLEQINNQSKETKIVTPVKRNHRQFQVNKCVGEARMMVSRIGGT